MAKPFPRSFVVAALLLGSVLAFILPASLAAQARNKVGAPLRTEDPGFAGLWVDPRTGADFLQLERKGEAWLFTAYGGDPDHPRYLSKGRLAAGADGVLSGQARDPEGYCCGNQGRVSLSLPAQDHLEVRALWWPASQSDPGEPLPPPYAMERVRTARSTHREADPPATAPPAPANAAKERLSLSWAGVWQGEGWGRYLMGLRGKTLYVVWYYGQPNGARYFARYQISADGRHAKGQAFGPPGREAAYFRHELNLDKDPKKPQARLKSWRLAAPLDDGRLVSFKQPKLSQAELGKLSDRLNESESAMLAAAMDDPALDPAPALERALASAAKAGKLLSR